mmetsp:Transcript_52005/g.114084  ORF Transcript_52005/g.114084 Transcript_52005/m.114084 type:complete len:447 (+) Transcript_52005:155-1495(+)
MQPLRVLLALVAAAVAQDIGGGTSVPECSCDCCMAVMRLPSEVEDVNNRFRCSFATAGGTCQSQCTTSSSDPVLTASAGPVDSQRFCFYKCRPLSGTVGAKCLRLNIMERQAVTRPSGNGGSADGFAFGPAMSANETTFGAQAEERTQSRVANQQAADQVGASHDQAVFDIRKSITNRLRAEAAAEYARASATEARVKTHAKAAELSEAEVDRVNFYVQQTSGLAKEATITAASQAKTAAEQAEKAEATLRALRRYAAGAAKEAALEARAEVFRQAKAAAEALSKSHMYLYGWDKPASFAKVAAVQAAEPYMKAMTAAVEAESQYEGAAKGLLDQAKGMQEKAFKLATQANMMEAHGDGAAAIVLRHEIQGLLDGAKGTEKQAQQYWEIANKAKKSVPEWQNGALMAAQRASWEFTQRFTPPPPGPEDMPAPPQRLPRVMGGGPCP